MNNIVYSKNVLPTLNNTFFNYKRIQNLIVFMSNKVKSLVYYQDSKQTINVCFNLKSILCRIFIYLCLKRLEIPKEKESWNVEWSDYNPPYFTLPQILKNPPPVWADPENVK